MKKSEMISELFNFLWENNGDYGLKRLALEDAADLLSLIESLGMKPPILPSVLETEDIDMCCVWEEE